MSRYKKPKAKWSTHRGTFVEEDRPKSQTGPSYVARERRKDAESKLKEMQAAMFKHETESDDERARRAAIKKAGYTKYK